MSRGRPLLLCALIALSAASGYASGPAPRGTVPVTTATLPDREPVRPLPFYYDLYTFRGQGGRTAIVSAFAVEAGDLETEPASASVRYRFSVTLVLADTARGTVMTTHDTVFVDVAHRLEGDHLLYTHVEMPAPPSATTRQRVIMTDATTPGIGQLYSESFPIPDYRGNDLMVSDIALGHPDARAGWRRGDVTLALIPASQFPSSAFDVYYEIYNLAAGNAYATEITIEAAGDGRHETTEPVHLRFSGESAAGRDAMLAELRRVETSLPKGSYRITVAITDLTDGRTASRSRHFEIRDRDRATMVAALPQSRLSADR